MAVPGNPANVFGPYAATAGAAIPIPGGGNSGITTLVVLIVGTGWTGNIAITGVPCRSGLGSTGAPALGYTTPASAAPSVTNPSATGLFFYRVDGCDCFMLPTVSAGSVLVYIHALNGGRAA